MPPAGHSRHRIGGARGVAESIGPGNADRDDLSAFMTALGARGFSKTRERRVIGIAQAMLQTLEGLPRSGGQGFCNAIRQHARSQSECVGLGLDIPEFDAVPVNRPERPKHRSGRHGHADDPVAARHRSGLCPVPGAIVDVWQCDARGNYSGHAVNPDSPNLARQRGRRREPDVPTRFLRGVLAADADGIVEFDAIYPGFYGERVVHTHYKVHVDNTAYLTSQALYPEAWNDRIFNDRPYSEGRGARRVLNADDSFGRIGGFFTVRERGGCLLATVNLSIRT